MARLIDITGKAISGEWGLDDVAGDGTPVLRTTNFTNDGVLDFSNVVTRNLAGKNLADKFLRKGDIIIEKSGGSDKQPVGRVVFFDGPENQYLFNNFTGLLRVRNQEHWLPRYVFYALFAKYRMGGTVSYENRTTGLHNLQTDSYVEKTTIPDLDYTGQEKACEILDGISKSIYLRKKQLQIFDTFIKARFVEMFGDPHNSDRYPYYNISELTEVISGGTPDRKNDQYWIGGTIPWVKTTELQNNVITETEEYITEKGLTGSSAKLVPASTILIAMYGQGKTRGMTALLGIEACTNQACACLLPTAKIDMHYFWNYLMLSYDKLRGLAQGGNQPNLNAGMIKSFPILIPPLEEQKKFVSFVEKASKSKATIQLAISEMQQLFDSLLQLYFG